MILQTVFTLMVLVGGIGLGLTLIGIIIYGIQQTRIDQTIVKHRKRK